MAEKNKQKELAEKLTSFYESPQKDPITGAWLFPSLLRFCREEKLDFAKISKLTAGDGIFARRYREEEALLMEYRTALASQGKLNATVEKFILEEQFSRQAAGTAHASFGLPAKETKENFALELRIQEESALPGTQRTEESICND